MAPDGTILQLKARFPIPGDKMHPIIRFYPEKTSAFTADKSESRLIFQFLYHPNNRYAIFTSSQHLPLNHTYAHAMYLSNRWPISTETSDIQPNQSDAYS